MIEVLSYITALGVGFGSGVYFLRKAMLWGHERGVIEERARQIMAFEKRKREVAARARLREKATADLLGNSERAQKIAEEIDKQKTEPGIDEAKKLIEEEERWGF